jgi:murein DD-endopeptidase MepM/ murein hydrolase activator NlpD
MKIHEPVKNYKHRKYPHGDISQFFAESPTLYRHLNMDGHNGIDIVRPWYSPLYAVEDGIVADVKNSPDGYGKHLRIITDTGHEWTYGHNALNLVEIGQKVKAGDEIAKMGNTGFVVSSHNGNGFWADGSNKWAGTHLHLGLREVEIVTRGGWRYNPNTPMIKVKNYNNGFHGSIDFAHMLMAEDEPDTDRKMDINIVIKLIQVLQRLGILKN